MSVDNSSDKDPSSLSGLVGSLSMDRLKQFVDEDQWYFSDESSGSSSLGDDSDNEEPEAIVSPDPEESLLPTEGRWVELCVVTTSTGRATHDSPHYSEDGSMSLEQVIDSFLSKLEPYTPAYDEETTDAGASADDTRLLLSSPDEGKQLSPAAPDSRPTVDQVSDPSPIGKEDNDQVTSPTAIPVKRPKYYYIANEILTSERTYVQGIRMIEKILHGAVKTARDTGKPLIPESARKRIFLNISEIYTLNSDFLNELEERILSWDRSPVICDALASRAPYLKLYSMYAAKFEDSQTAFTEAQKKYKPFKELVHQVENSRLCKGLPITSYMLYPIQRIPRYKLLLRDYLKLLPEDHPDMNNTKGALKTISEVAQHLNDRIKELEEQATLVKLQKLFTGKEALVLPGRRFILRGPVELVSGKKMNKRKKRVLLLFSDILLVTKITRSIKFKTLVKFQLVDIQVSSMYSHTHDNDFCVFAPSIKKPFKFCARTRDERDTWIKHLRTSIKIEMDRIKSFEVIKQSHISLSIMKERSLQVIFQDPSLEPRQPKCTRKGSHPRRHMTVNPATNHHGNNGEGLEEVDGPGIEETDSGMGESANELMQEMEEMATSCIDDDDEDSGGYCLNVLRPGQDNTLSCYIKYKRDDPDSLEVTDFAIMWFVMTYTSLTGYCGHKHDEACWAIPLAGYKLITSKQSLYTFKLTMPTSNASHVFQMDNEYDYMRWSQSLNQILNSDINKL